MKIEDIRKIEEARQEPASWNVIHLLKEDKFYRAYDWSAWLISVFPIGETSTPVARRLKDGSISVFVGIPCSSLAKFVPKEGTIDFNPIDNDRIDVTIELPAEIGEASFDNLNKQKEEWKASLPIQKPKSQRREEQEYAHQAPRVVRFSDILAEIVALPIEDMSPREAYNVVCDLRKRVSQMF